MSEHDDQAAFFQWCTLYYHKWPELFYIHAIPNHIPDHKVRRYMIAEGLRPGPADICLPVARREYFGLYIELKSKGGTVRKEQKKYQVLYEEQGYYTAVMRDWQVATQLVEWYLDGEPTAFPGERDIFPGVIEVEE